MSLLSLRNPDEDYSVIGHQDDQQLALRQVRGWQRKPGPVPNSALLRALVLAVLSSVSDACPMDLTGRGRYTWMLFASSAAFDPEPNTCTADVVVNQSDVIFTWNNCNFFMWISICTVPVISVLVMILRQQAEQLQNLVDIKKTIVHFTIGEGMARESTMETLNNLVAERIRGLHGGGGEEHPEDSDSSWEPQTLEEFIQYYGSEPEEMLGRSGSDLRKVHLASQMKKRTLVFHSA